MQTFMVHGGGVLLIDDQDAHLVEGRKLYLQTPKPGHTRVARGAGKKHELIHRLVAGAQPGRRIRFRDGNHLNCTRANLRAWESEIFIEDDEALVTLHPAKWTRMDVADLPLVKGKALTLGTSGTGKEYALISEGTQTFLLHRILMNPPKHLEVDHIDGDGLNNTRANLRLASKKQNHGNRGVGRGLSEGGSSKYKGVYRNYKKWSANCTRVSLGSFHTELEAAKAYDKAALARYGEYARTNAQIFPDDFAPESP